MQELVSCAFASIAPAAVQAANLPKRWIHPRCSIANPNDLRPSARPANALPNPGCHNVVLNPIILRGCPESFPIYFADTKLQKLLRTRSCRYPQLEELV